jgi:hypothetical protein
MSFITPVCRKATGVCFFGFVGSTLLYRHPQPSIADFQHGLLYIGGGRDSIAGSTPYVTWWNMSNPRSPVLVQSNTLGSGNKPHSVTFWGNKFDPGHQGPSEIWDYTTRTFISTYTPSGATGVWRTLQPPYDGVHTHLRPDHPPPCDSHGSIKEQPGGL